MQISLQLLHLWPLWSIVEKLSPANKAFNDKLTSDTAISISAGNNATTTLSTTVKATPPTPLL